MSSRWTLWNEILSHQIMNFKAPSLPDLRFQVFPFHFFLHQHSLSLSVMGSKVYKQIPELMWNYLPSNWITDVFQLWGTITLIHALVSHPPLTAVSFPSSKDVKNVPCPSKHIASLLERMDLKLEFCSLRQSYIKRGRKHHNRYVVTHETTFWTHLLTILDLFGMTRWNFFFKESWLAGQLCLNTFGTDLK